LLGQLYAERCDKEKRGLKWTRSLLDPASFVAVFVKIYSRDGKSAFPDENSKSCTRPVHVKLFGRIV
jgi:hypothetical protein